MKIGISSYSFIRLVRNGTMRQIDVAAKAREMGFDVIEFSDFLLPAGETLLTFAAKMKEECSRVGIETGNYTVRADFLEGSGQDWEKEANRLKTEVEAAKILGAPGIRHDASRGFPPSYRGRRGFEDALPFLIQGCRAVTEYAAQYGIKTMVENHGYFCQDSDRIEKLINGVNHPNFGALIDIGNFLCVDEGPAKALGKLAPYAFHVHVKDFHVKSGMLPDPGSGWFRSRGGNYLRGAIIGHGEVPVLQCFGILKNYGYNGVLSIEFEGIEEPLTGISMSCDNLKRFVNQAFKPNS